MIKNEIFRKYDIRGIYAENEFTKECAYVIGYHFSKIIQQKNNIKDNTITIGYDGRKSSIEIYQNLSQGIIDAGSNINLIGLVATPMLMFANRFFKNNAAIMITASHNPKEYNGMKIILNSKSFFDENLQDLYKVIISKNIVISDNKGKITENDIYNDYLYRIFESIYIDKKIKIIFDCANAATCLVVQNMCEKYIQTNQKASVIFSEIDGNFPNHEPDPSKEKNLVDLKKHLLKGKFDIGIGFDGDGDRLGIIDEKGNFIDIDKIILLYIKNIIDENNGKILNFVLDIKCSAVISNFINKNKCNVFISKTGHSYIKQSIKDNNAIFGAESSGHIFFNDKYYGYDDGIYSALRIIEIMSKNKRNISDLINDLPEINIFNKIIYITNDMKFEIINKIKNYLDNLSIQYSSLDGVKIFHESGSLLIRTSNTQSCLTLTYEYFDKKNKHFIDDILNNICYAFNLKISE